MAIKVNNGSGSFSSTTLWETVTNTPTAHATTNISISTSNLYTEVFTAPSTTGTCTACIVWSIGNIITTYPVYTCQLQEYNGAVWSDVGVTATIAMSGVSVYSTSINTNIPIIFRFATPYTFTTTTSGYYRFRLVSNWVTTFNVLRSDTSGTKIAYMAVDNRTGALGATDNCWILGGTGTTVYTVTQDSNVSIGSGDNTIISTRNWNMGLVIGNGGKYTTNNTNLSLTLNGSLWNGGEFDINYTGTTNTWSLIFTPAVDGDYSLYSNYTATIRLDGQSKVYWKTSLVSGSGTTANPLIVSDPVNWNIGDEIMVTPTNNVAAASTIETEYRYIIGKTGTTTYTLSTTSGGTESGFTYTHSTSAEVLNLTRNVTIKTNSTTKGFYYTIYGGYLATNLSNIYVGYASYQWNRFENVGTITANRAGVVYLSVGSSPDKWDYNVYYNIINLGAYTNTMTNRARTYTGNIFTKGAYIGVTLNTKPNHILNDFYAVNLGNMGFQFSNCVGTTFNRFKSINTGQSSFGYAGFYFASMTNCICNDFVGYLSNNTIYVSAVVNCTINDFKSNLIAYVTNVYACDTRNLVVAPTMVFYNPEFRHYGTSRLFYLGTATSLLGTTYLDGTQIGLHNISGITSKHETYTLNGTFYSTLFSGSTDTNQRTANSNSLKMLPVSDDGMVWEYQIPVKIGQAAQTFGFIKKDVAMTGSTVITELWLPGSTVADTTYTIPNNNSWNVYSLVTNYTGLDNTYATIRITAYGTSGQIYIDDISNGTNILTSLDLWDRAMPSKVMYPELGNPDEVWAVQTSTLTTAGTVGKIQVDTLIETQNNQGLIISK